VRISINGKKRPAKDWNFLDFICTFILDFCLSCVVALKYVNPATDANPMQFIYAQGFAGRFFN